MKNIDAEKLISELERMREINRKELWADHITPDVFHGRTQTLNYLFELITSLQHEQPEVDIEKELISYYNKHFSPCEDGVLLSEESGGELKRYDYESIARHFYSLGLKVNNDAVIEKACEWLKNNVTYTHPRTGETKCVVNLNAFIDAMKG